MGAAFFVETVAGVCDPGWGRFGNAGAFSDLTEVGYRGRLHDLSGGRPQNRWRYCLGVSPVSLEKCRLR